MLIEIKYNQLEHTLETKPLCLLTAPDEASQEEYDDSQHIRVLMALELMFPTIVTGESEAEKYLGCENCLGRARLQTIKARSEYTTGPVMAPHKMGWLMDSKHPDPQGPQEDWIKRWRIMPIMCEVLGSIDAETITERNKGRLPCQKGVRFDLPV